MMEDFRLRFPLLGEMVLQNLDGECLVKIEESSPINAFDYLVLVSGLGIALIGITIFHCYGIFD